MKSEKHDLAIYFLEKAIQCDPNLWAAYHNLGLLYIDFKELRKGCDCLKKAKGFGHFESEKAYNEYCKATSYETK